jgi:hypothetical protein
MCPSARRSRSRSRAASISKAQAQPRRARADGPRETIATRPAHVDLHHHDSFEVESGTMAARSREKRSGVQDQARLRHRVPGVERDQSIPSTALESPRNRRSGAWNRPRSSVAARSRSTPGTEFDCRRARNESSAKEKVRRVEVPRVQRHRRPRRIAGRNPDARRPAG